jgi:hypothetical protein
MSKSNIGTVFLRLQIYNNWEVRNCKRFEIDKKNVVGYGERMGVLGNNKICQKTGIHISILTFGKLKTSQKLNKKFNCFLKKSQYLTLSHQHYSPCLQMPKPLIIN